MFSTGKNWILNALGILCILKNFWHKKGSKYLYYINYHLMFYPSRQHVKWKHFKFTFNNDFMMNRELNFNVTRNDFRNVLISCWVTLFLRVSYWGQVVEMNFWSIDFDKLLKILLFPASLVICNDDVLPMYYHTGIYFSQ